MAGHAKFLEKTPAPGSRGTRMRETAPQARVDAPRFATPSSTGAPSASGSAGTVQTLQRLAGNQAVMRMLDVQRAAGDLREPSDEAIRTAAAEGVRTPSTSLPYLDRIQASFGRHFIGDIQAHVGPSATRASQAMSAQAYATGNHVVFGARPDLRTAAHEATHVVQQRAGVQFAGGIGRVGDRYERHADAVADAVVAGRSVERMLTMLAASASAPQPGANATRVPMDHIQSKPYLGDSTIIQRYIQTENEGIFHEPEDCQTLLQENCQDDFVKKMIEVDGFFLIREAREIQNLNNGRDTGINILSPDKHVIGEEHLKTQFPTAYSHWSWSGVDRMVEALSHNDLIEDSTGKRAKADPSHPRHHELYNALPLEDTMVKNLTLLLTTNTWLNLSKAGLKISPPSNPTNQANIQQVRLFLPGSFSALVDLSQYLRKILDSSSSSIITGIFDMFDKRKKEMRITIENTQRLGDILGLLAPEIDKKTPDLTVLGGLIEPDLPELISIIEHGASMYKHVIADTQSAFFNKHELSKIQSATTLFDLSAAREKHMFLNISKRLSAPGLVKIGANHVRNLRALYGQNILEETYKIRLYENYGEFDDACTARKVRNRIGLYAK